MTRIPIDTQAVDGRPYLVEVWPPGRLRELLRRSSILVVTAPYTEETHRLVYADALSAMVPGSYLIVVSRGVIVDEGALTQALRSDYLAGAALDVTNREPLPSESSLWELPNLILTPHVAGVSAQKERRCVEILRDNLLRFAQGEPLLNQIDQRYGYWWVI